MESFILLGVYFLLMGSIVLLFSGLVSFFLPKIHFLAVAGISGLLGVIFSYIYGYNRLLLFAVIFNVVLSLIAIGLAKYGRYLKHKAECEMAADELI